MNSKLTLKLNKEIIEKAKKYAASQHKSLSRMIEAYLKSIVDREATGSDIKITPYVRQMKTGVSVPAELDIKKEYADHLSKKYQ